MLRRASHNRRCRGFCQACDAEFLVAFSCKTRYLCPSCHAKRLEIWADWLEHEILYAVPHRQFVFTVPKRLRPFFLHDRALLGLLSRVAYRTLRDFMRATLREPDAVPGVIAFIQTFGSLANWHPHLHCLVTDGNRRELGPRAPRGWEPENQSGNVQGRRTRRSLVNPRSSGPAAGA